jgi:hypothetical protein
LDVKQEQQSNLIAGLIGAGLQSADQRQNLLYILRETQRMGFANAPEEYRQLLSGDRLTAGLAQREAFKFAENDPITQEIQKLVGAPILDRVVEELRDLNQQIAQADAEREEKFTKTIKQSTDEFITKIAAIIIEAFNTSANDIKKKIKKGKSGSIPPT